MNNERAGATVVLLVLMILAIVLTACGGNVHSYEVHKARLTCEEHGGVDVMFFSAFDGNRITSVTCEDGTFVKFRSKHSSDYKGIPRE
jgi:hypothetical protein